MPRYLRHIFICTNLRPADSPRGSCASRGSEAIAAAFKAELKKRRLGDYVRANPAGCLSNCAEGPTVVVYPEGVWYGRVTLQDVDEIVERHIIRGEVVERLLVKEFSDGPKSLPPLDLPSTVCELRDPPKSPGP